MLSKRERYLRQVFLCSSLHLSYMASFLPPQRFVKMRSSTTTKRISWLGQNGEKEPAAVTSQRRRRLAGCVTVDLPRSGAGSTWCRQRVQGGRVGVGWAKGGGMRQRMEMQASDGGGRGDGRRAAVAYSGSPGRRWRR